MAGSAADAIGQAVERSKQLLFPLKPEKWFALGFTVFLAQCGEGNFNSGQTTNLPFNSGSTGSPKPSSGSGPFDFHKLLDEALRAWNAEYTLYLTLAIVGVLLTIGLSITILWFSSRAKLMFVESVVWDRVELGQQWNRAADLGMSLFKFRLWLSLGGGLLTLAGVVAGLVVGFVDYQVGNFLGSHALLGYALAAVAALLLGVPLAIAGLLLDDFVVPLMVVRNVRVGEAWGMCRREVLTNNLGSTLLFYLLRAILFIALGVAALVLRCITCCISGLPYLSSVLLLPVFVFWRAFSLYYMEQLGLPIFPRPEPAYDSYEQWRFPR